MVVDPDAQTFQAGLESLCQILAVVTGQHHAGNIQAKAPEHINEPNHIPVIGNAQVTAR